MRNATLKCSVYLLVGISGIAWFSLAFFNNLDISKLRDFFGLLPKVVSIDLLVVAAFVKWGWRLRIFKGWLVPFPDLNGSWVGFIYSDWKNPETGTKLPPIPMMLTVNQSFFNINFMMHTSEMESSSYSEGFLVDSERQIKSVAYSYTSKPRLSLSDRSTPHDGTVVFRVIEKPKKKLIGRYWTERLTKGEMVLEYHSEKRLEELPENLGEPPVTENRSRC